MRAIPEFFGVGEEMMFGWLHPAASGTDRRTSVVLCPTLGMDETCSYRDWRILAERLAAAGFNVLRFDYLGTDDSADDSERHQRVARWQRSITLAAGHARARTGAERLALVGPRLGGTLAACVAPGIQGVGSLVLWSPFRSGREFSREMTALARLTRPGSVDDSGNVDAAGFLLTRETIDELRSLDILALRERPAPRVLLIERAGFSADQQLSAHLVRLGCTLTTAPSPVPSDATAPGVESEVPEQILDRIVEWLVEVHPESTIGDAVPDAGAPGLGQGDGWRDEPRFFGPDHRLFGILTRPASDTPPPIAVVFLNTGAEHHVGSHGRYVPLARAWAREGYASLRFDLGGIGDSRSPAGVIENDEFPAAAMEELAAAVAEVRRCTQARHLVVIGVCSGGWHAYRAARDGLPIDGIMAINPAFEQREEAKDTLQKLAEQRELERYGRSATDPEKWKKLLGLRVGVGTIARLAAAGLMRWLHRRAAEFGIPVGGPSLSSELRTIAGRKLRVAFVFAKADLSWTYFKLHARRAIRRAGRGMTWTVVDDGDHTFQSLRSQRAMSVMMTDFLKHCVGLGQRSGVA